MKKIINKKSKTFAEVAKPIQNLIEKLKDKPKSQANDNTIMLLEQQLDDLFAKQEAIKEAQNLQPEIEMEQPMEQFQQQDMAQQRKYFAKGGLKNKKSYRYQLPGAEAMENENDLSELNNIYVKGDANTQTGKNYNDYTDEELFGTSPVVTPLMTDYKGTYGNNRPIDTSEPRFNKGDIGTAGALGTSLLGNLIQRSNLNKVAPPRTLVAPTFTAGRTPVKADYSADLQSADNQFNAARRGVMMNSGNYSTQAGNLGQLRAEQLRNRSKILQNQNNANAVLMNEYQKAQADAINKNALSNYTTDQENMENLYNYNLWKTGQTNAADASAFNTSGQMFNNMVTGQNQLDAAEMYRRMYAQKVRDDLAFKAMGGTVRNYFAKGGTVYSQKLQNVLKEDTNTKAAQMDAEYASYLDAKGQPLQDTFKSKVTGLDYKVLPRKEKDLYAAKLWEEAHGSAPTKSQVAATTKAIEGKKTSSPGAKTVAQMMSDKFSVSNQEGNLVNAVNADREDTMSYLPSQIENNKLKQGLNRQQVENLPKATGEAEYYDMTDFIPSKGALMGGAALAGLGFGYLKRQAMKELPNVLEAGIKMGTKASRHGLSDVAETTAERTAKGIADWRNKSKAIPGLEEYYAKKAKNFTSPSTRVRDVEGNYTKALPSAERKLLPGASKSSIELEDEGFNLAEDKVLNSIRNKKLDQKLKISEGANKYSKRTLQKMNKKLDNQEIPTADELKILEKYSKNRKNVDKRLTEIATANEDENLWLDMLSKKLDDMEIPKVVKRKRTLKK